MKIRERERGGENDGQNKDLRHQPQREGIDERGVRLLRATADLGTGSPKKLHGVTDILVSTTRYRLNNLKNDSIIENDLYDIDLEAFGLGIIVAVEMLADYSGSHEEVGNKLLGIEGVTQFYFTMGETDFIVVTHLAGSDRVECLISDLEAASEVERMSSTFVISSMRDSRRTLQSYTLETLLDELGIED